MSRRLENLYAGLGVPTFVGGVDLEYVRKLKKRCLDIVHEGQTVLFIDLDVLLKAHKERKNEREETQEGIGMPKSAAGRTGCVSGL